MTDHERGSTQLSGLLAAIAVLLGVLGLPSALAGDDPRPPSAAGDAPSWLQLAAGDDHTCARKTDGTLWCWGSNTDGQLGDGNIGAKASPVQVGALGTLVAEVAAGVGHTCARKTDGTLWCWGQNFQGQLGDGDIVDKASPVQVSALGTLVAEIAAGRLHTCARKTDGTLWCWGSNIDGQLGDGTAGNKPSPVQVGALGTLVAEVAAGVGHTCARKTDGTLWCWGLNFQGQLGDGTTGDKSSPVQVGALGTLVAEIAAGNLHTCARKTDGTLWCWGNNDHGQLGDGTSKSKSSPVQVGALGTLVAEVAAGGNHTCARKTDGTLWCWGTDGTGNTDVLPMQVDGAARAAARAAAQAEQEAAIKRQADAEYAEFARAKAELPSGASGSDILAEVHRERAELNSGAKLNSDAENAALRADMDAQKTHSPLCDAYRSGYQQMISNCIVAVKEGLAANIPQCVQNLGGSQLESQVSQCGGP